MNMRMRYMVPVNLTNAEFKRNPAPTIRRLQECGPLIRVKLPLIGRTWLATTADSVETVLKDRERFARQLSRAGKKLTPGLPWWAPRWIRVLTENMLASDGADHRRLRGLVDAAFFRSRVSDLRQPILEKADSLIDQFPRAEEFDLVSTFANRLPLEVICQMLGLPPEDVPQFASLASRLTTSGSLFGILRAIPSISKLLKYLRGQFEQVRQQPRAGLIGALVTIEEQGDALSENELLAMVFQLLIAGHLTTTHLIALSVLTLMERDDLRTRWLACPELRPAAVDELLRFHSPVQFSKPRFAASDMTVFGQSLRRRDLVLPLLAGANHDPMRFADPETIDFDRRDNQHFGFGSGIHFCLGAQLARLETEIALTRLFERCPAIRLAIPAEQLNWPTRLGIRTVSSVIVHDDLGDSNSR